ncbi:ubiquitin fusion degradation protein [Thecamonas trahens ATCC 50062]|uniref:Ubiquitin fusion degradation protein n=1 Tax=Thecamonas trahens ATCC 50062 TaxID=461836 RepID=A0A0L0DJI9_THETB|nr:ubiquitin fusion degradation protein [Thecamonas trahens ATCC 50062]KNC51468.1 ubiquitin fusion degradation protein [Thecamonas trahens ATCC 50062]|eukprot:XP_013756130.1 ubiquitin fusion degradation protein [Thecamonas trahens ATCC 50062]
MDFFGFGRRAQPTTFAERYQVYPVSFLGRPDLETGNKIVLPPSALDKLARLSIVYPMLFELRNENTGSISHCGVLEFVAEEGRAYIPYWLMQSLLLQEGGILTVRNVSLPLGTFVKLKPQSVAFLDISNPKAVLENSLRSFATLTKDDVIKIHYNDRDYYLAVEEVRPDTHNGGICVIETDMEVDFSPPVGYVDPSTLASKVSSSTAAASSSSAAAPVTADGLVLGAGADDAKPKQSPNSDSDSYSDSDSDSDSDAAAKASYWAKLGSGHSLRSSGSTARASASASSANAAADPAAALPLRDRKVASSVPENFTAFGGKGRSLRD